MKWKCIDCYAVFHAAGGRQVNCPSCGSVNCFDCNVEPVAMPGEPELSRMQLVSELPAALELMPVKPGEVQRAPQRVMSAQEREDYDWARRCQDIMGMFMGRRPV